MRDGSPSSMVAIVIRTSSKSGSVRRERVLRSRRRPYNRATRSLRRNALGPENPGVEATTRIALNLRPERGLQQQVTTPPLLSPAFSLGGTPEATNLESPKSLCVDVAGISVKATAPPLHFTINGSALLVCCYLFLKKAINIAIRLKIHPIITPHFVSVHCFCCRSHATSWRASSFSFRNSSLINRLVPDFPISVRYS